MIRLNAFFITAFMLLLSDATAQEGQWLSQNSAIAYAKSLKGSGKIVTSVECRNISSVKAIIKPEISIVSGPNVQKRDWVLFLYQGEMDYHPGMPDTWNQWRRVVHKILAGGAGGTQYHCSLFHRK